MSNLKEVEKLCNGQAYDKFKEFIEYQGGNLDCLNVKPKYRYKNIILKEGYISLMNSEDIGKLSCMLEAGRINKDDLIDYTAGIVLSKKTTGDYIKENDLLATLYSSTKEDLKQYEDSVII